MTLRMILCIWIKAGFQNGKKLLWCHAYREHTSTLGSSLRSQKDYLEKFLLQWDQASNLKIGKEPSEVHVVGDMNLDAHNGRWLDPSYHLHSLSQMVQQSCALGNFAQLVCVPTRFQFNSISGKTNFSCIDHVYVNYQSRCSEISVITFGNSDHDLIGYVRYAKDPPSPARTIRKRSYKNFNEKDFLNHLRQIDWSAVFYCQDVDVAVETFTRMFKFVLDEHAPWVLYQIRKKFSPWVTEETIKLIKERNQAKLQASDLSKRGIDSSETWKKYKTLRNRVNNKLKYEELTYKQQKIKASLDSSADCWKTTKMFMNWSSNSGPPSQLHIKGKLVTKASILASEMNRFFIDKVNLIRTAIQPLQNTFSNCREIMREKKCKMELTYATHKKVLKILKSLKSSKSLSIDELDSYCVKTSAEIIAPSLHHIVTLSLMQRKFPSSWKMSKVIPLHKKGSRLEKQNYRPVAILSPLSKVLEKIAYEQIYRYFTNNKIFDPHLHGFRGNRSTQTALITMYDRWVQAASVGQISGAILLDLSAAFDLVDHRLLIAKLKIYGADDECVQWIESYLTDRAQAVWIDHVFSEYAACTVGVPQGSILGPLFFLVYFNDLPGSLNNPADAYADDTTLTATGPSIEAIEESLNKDCMVVSNWMRANKLKINPDKTHILTLGTQNKLGKLERPLSVHMDKVLLKEDPTQTEQLLGCHIQGNLRWQSQITTLKAKLSKRISGLKHLTYICGFSIRKMVAEGCFNSVLIYCLPLFGGLEKHQVKELQILQNQAVRLVCRAPPRANRSLMFKKVGWLTVNQLIHYHSLIALFRVRQSKTPEYLADILCRDSRNYRIMIPRQNLTLTSSSFCVRSASYWNQLPSELRQQEKLGVFKRDLHRWIIENTPSFLD